MRHWGARRHPARLVAELALQEEGVGVDHTVNRPWGGKRDKARWYLLKKRCSGQQRRPQPGRQVALVARLGARPRIMGANAARPTLPKTVWLTKFSFPARRWAESGLRRFSAVAVWMRPDEAQDLLEAGRRGRQSGPVSPQVHHLNALHDVGPLRSLRFGLLSPEAHEQEEVGEGVEGGVCEVRESSWTMAKEAATKMSPGGGSTRLSHP